MKINYQLNRIVRDDAEVKSVEKPLARRTAQNDDELQKEFHRDKGVSA